MNTTSKSQDKSKRARTLVKSISVPRNIAPKLTKLRKVYNTVNDSFVITRAIDRLYAFHFEEVHGDIKILPDTKEC